MVLVPFSGRLRLSYLRSYGYGWMVLQERLDHLILRGDDAGGSGITGSGS